MTANSTCDDLSASAFSILGSLNDSREIKKLGGKLQDGKINIPKKTVVWQWKNKNYKQFLYLYLGTFVPNDSRYCCKCGELVGCDLRVHACKVAQQSGLPHRGETNKADTSITGFGNIKT